MGDPECQELAVYEMAKDLVDNIVELIEEFPRNESYKVGEQLLKSAKVAVTHITRAQENQEDETIFESAVTEAIGEVVEVEVWSAVAKKEGYLVAEDGEDLIRECEEINTLLYGLLGDPPTDIFEE